MLKRLDVLLWLLAAIVLGRLISMAFIPMIGTTEARYAEIARIMAETGDWITPWFDYGVPFWGKPPLSFWSEALSFRLFGVKEFAARLPSWLANLGSLALIYIMTLRIAGYRQAVIAMLIFSTMMLSYLLSGAVLTDPFLALGTTLSLVSLILSLKQPASPWRWWFFVGLAIGLLAKGPLALILIGGPVCLWLTWRQQWHTRYNIPWTKGLLLTALLTMPWYIAAELKTPGFINYFIVGEHFLRFVDSGWQGDLYGSAHNQPFGTIWLYWLWASFPWGPIAVIVLIWHGISTKRSNPLSQKNLSNEHALLLIAALFPSLFFTFSGNVLWTYQLPSLAPLAILTAMLLTNVIPTHTLGKLGMIGTIITVPLIVILLIFYTHFYPEKVKTEKSLVAYYNEHKSHDTPALIYLGKTPFSARFYSQGRITTMTSSEIKTLVSKNNETIYFIAVANENADKVIASLSGPVTIKWTNKNFTLLKTDGISPNEQ